MPPQLSQFLSWIWDTFHTQLTNGGFAVIGSGVTYATTKLHRRWKKPKVTVALVSPINGCQWDEPQVLLTLDDIERNLLASLSNPAHLQYPNGYPRYLSEVRGKDQFKAEVARWKGDVGECLPLLAQNILALNEGCAEFEVTNHSDSLIEGLRIEIIIEGRSIAVVKPTPFRLLGLFPKRPRKWGAILESDYYNKILQVNSRTEVQKPQDGTKAILLKQDASSFVVRLPSFDISPRQTVNTLDLFSMDPFVIIAAPEYDSLEAVIKVSAKGFDGIKKSTMQMPVADVCDVTETLKMMLRKQPWSR